MTVVPTQVSSLFLYRCALCHHVVPGRCPASCSMCGGDATFSLAPPQTRVPVRNRHTAQLLAVTPNVARVKARLLAEVAVSDMPRVSIHPLLDQLLAGQGGADDAPIVGVVGGQLLTLTGDKGAGKSTIMMEALGHVAAQGYDVLYGLGEESESAASARAHRLAVWAKDENVARHLYTVESTVIEDFFDEVKIKRPRLAIYDSTQVARSRVIDAMPRSDAMVMYTITTGFALAHALESSGTVLMFVNQLVKDGTGAGPNAAGHGGDMVVRLTKETDWPRRDMPKGWRPDPDGRILSCEKNRHGPDSRQIWMAMTPTGLAPKATPTKTERASPTAPDSV